VESFDTEDKRRSKHNLIDERQDLISSFNFSACCQQLRDHSHSTASTSNVKRSPSTLNTNEMNTILVDPSSLSPQSELQLKPQQTREQTPPPHDLHSKHEGGESIQTEDSELLRQILTDHKSLTSWRASI
jgi:hypothetical protein